MTKDVSITLYRYDLLQPPENWDTSFLNREYYTTEYGHKNKAGLFFFTDSEKIAKELGYCAATKYSQTEYFLTTTQIQKVKLIDFTNRNTIYQMLCLLKDLEIDVLTKDFKTYEKKNHFGQLKDSFEAAELETDTCKKLDIIKKLTVHSDDFQNISLFGQRLTDFYNGTCFKKLVTEKYPDIGGYLWREFNDERGFTYCLFDAQKLTTKTTENIKLE